MHVCGVVHEDIDAVLNREGCLNLISDGSIILVLVYLGGLGPSLCKFRQAEGLRELATTRSPRARASKAMFSPMPEVVPVMSQTRC